MTKRFQKFMDRHYRATESKRTGFRWTVALIKKMMEVAWDMWEHRNGILKADPDQHDALDKLDKLNAKLAEAFEQGVQGLLDQDRFHFRADLGEALQWPIAEKRTWLESVSLAREAATAAAAEIDPHEGERQRMQAWLRGQGMRSR